MLCIFLNKDIWKHSIFMLLIGLMIVHCPDYGKMPTTRLPLMHIFLFCKKNLKNPEYNNPLKVLKFQPEQKELLPCLAWTSTTDKTRTHNHTHLHPMVTAVGFRSPDRIIARLLMAALYIGMPLIFFSSHPVLCFIAETCAE